MNNAVEMYTAQLLYGQRFLSDYGNQLKTLYSNSDFMAIVHKIQKQSPAEENENTIEEIKHIAKTTLFNNKAVFNFEALQSIVDSVVAKGKAQNSAFISVYCAMRIFELSEKNNAATVLTQKPSPPPASTPVSIKGEMDFRLAWPAEYRCEDGHYVRSKNEALVDNWLYSHFVTHAYEKAVFSADANYTYCSDFFLPQYKLFIEIWGMNSKEYETRKQNKIEFYNKNGYDLLQIYGDDVKNLDDILSKGLRKRNRRNKCFFR